MSSRIIDLSGKNSKGFYCMKLKIVQVNGNSNDQKNEITENKKLKGPLCVRSGKRRGGMPGECVCTECQNVFDELEGIVPRNHDSEEESYN
jgi:hypothetical protein